MERDSGILPVFKQKLHEAFKKQFGDSSFKIPLSEFIVTAHK